MKNINIVNRTVAQKMGVDLSIVEKVNKAYWKEIVTKLRSLDESAVHIKKIGTISVSPYKINSYIKVLIKQIRNVKTSPKYRTETRNTYLNQYYGDLKKILVKRNQIAIEYYNKNQNESSNRLLEVNTPSIQE